MGTSDPELSGRLGRASGQDVAVAGLSQIGAQPLSADVAAVPSRL